MSDLPEPRANPLLLGHQAADRVFAAAVEQGRLHHAWLLLGPPGIGKATLAYRFARRLLAGRADIGPDDPVFRRIAAGTHADLLTMERSLDDKRKKLRSEIVVDEVREVSSFMHLTPAEGGWRVVIVDGAEDLNRNAANALLKVLEEPPGRAVLILACAAAGRLLPTIRSRCRRLRLDPLADADVAELLARARPDLPASEPPRIASLAGGSVRRALALADEGGVALAELAGRAVARLDRLTTEDAVASADALGREDDAFDTFLTLLRAGVADAVRNAARAGRAALRDRPLGDWVAAWQAVGELQSATLGLHLDKREAVVQAFALLSGRSRPEPF